MAPVSGGTVLFGVPTQPVTASWRIIMKPIHNPRQRFTDRYYRSSVEELEIERYPQYNPDFCVLVDSIVATKQFKE